MPRSQVPQQTWVIVADGGQARVYSAADPLDSLSLAFERSAPDARKPTRDLGADRPGRQENSGGAHQGLSAKTDWHEQAKADFISSFADDVSRKAARAAVGRIILVAPPRVLGQLRKALPQRLHSKISDEIGKDLVHVAAHDLPQYLKAALETGSKVASDRR